MMKAIRAAIGVGTVVAAIVISTTGHPSASAGLSEGNREQILSAFSRLPLAFVENRGQTDPRVRYYAQGPRFAFYLTPEEVVLQFVAPSPARDKYQRPRGLVTPVVAIEPPANQPGTQGVALGLRFLASNPHVMLLGEDRASGETNYFRGADPARWQKRLSHYSQVVYRELWPGIDLRLREQAGTLKYEFRLRPGARLSDIRLAYTGADSVALDATGELLIRTTLGVLRDSPPIAYQDIAGARLPVESRYVLSGDSYGFASARYDEHHELIVDPGLDYSTYLGGSSHEWGAGIAVDGAGNAFVVGVTQSPDFPTRAGSFDRTGAAGNNLDAFVSKINSTGTALIYSTFLGGSNFEWGRAIAIDGAGNAYIAGQTRSSDFPTTGGAFDRTFNVDTCPRCGIDQYDAFVTKLNPSGSGLVYSTFLGGFDFDDGLGIAVDTAGNAYVTGETGSTNFPTTSGAFDTTRNGAFDAFVTKLNATGSALIYSTFMGGTEVDFGVRVAIGKDGANSAFVMGSTRSPDFPATVGAFDTASNGEFDVFVAKLNGAGSALVYSTFLGGSGFDSGGGLAIDFAGNAYVAGGTGSFDFPTTPGAFDTVSDDSEAFVTKINATGTGLVYSTLLGGTASEGANSIVLDAGGNAYLTGGTSSADFPTTPGAFDNQFNGGVTDAFVSKLNAAGSALIYSTFLGGADSEGGLDLALDNTGSVYITGQTMSTNFPTTLGALDSVFNGDPLIFWADAFVTKLTLASGPPPAAALSSVSANPASVVGGNGSTGTVTLTSAAPPGGATVSLSSSNANVAAVPPSVTVPSNAASASFAITTSTVAAGTAVTITGTYAGAGRTATLTVNPAPPPASLQSLSVSPASVTGGAGSQGAVTLSSAAPAGGMTVALSSSHPAASVPASVKVVQGSTIATFPIPTISVTASTAVTLTASAGGVSRTATLTVTPSAQTATLTVTATGRNGERVTSTPAGINTAVGSTGSASFATGTAITLRVTHNRDAIWSGACSSGGQKRKTCAFTLNGNASVTANVK